MRDKMVRGALLIVGLINFLPLMGILSAQRLGDLYGIEPPSGDLLILMQHRALLFGIVGGLVLVSVVRRSLQTAAMVCAGTSMFGFMVLVWAQGGAGEALMRIHWVDLVGLVFLALAIGLRVAEPVRETHAQ